MSNPETEKELSELERMKQARKRRLLMELNALSIQRRAIEEELKSLGWKPPQKHRA